MGLADLFKANENERLKARISELEKMLTPEMRELDSVSHQLTEKREQMAAEEAEHNQRISNLEKQLTNLTLAMAELNANIASARERLVETNDAVLMQEFGLYEPKYDFANADDYKARLLENRAEQKEMIRNKTAATGNENWTVNNNAAKGKKMVSDMQKLLIRAFNSECDEVISKVKFNNVEASIKRITASRDAISKLGDIMGVSITPRYYRLKIDELHLAYEYQVKKQEEKEALRQARAEQRELEKLQREIEDARKKISKDKKHYENALAQAQERLSAEKDEAKRADLLKKVAELEGQIEKLDGELKTVDYREANQKAGYVYIISNIGAFGENVYKIGMTRRLEPQDRIDELGDASVPFEFDVHALIFSDDAPKLEAALHHAFEDRKVNMVNTRREFFRVTLDEIKQVVRDNFDKTVEFIDVPAAEQYRETLLIQEKTK